MPTRVSDPNFRIVAFDPGGTTGWAQYDALFMPDLENSDGDKLELVEQALTVGHLGPHEHHEDLYEFLESAHILGTFGVAYESFEFRQGKQRDNINLMSREYIGVIKLFCAQRGLDSSKYTAGNSKGFTDDLKLKAMGWYHPGWKHANDATRILVYELVKKHRRFDLIECWRNLV